MIRIYALLSRWTALKKASVKLAFTFGICLFSIVENCVVFSDGLTNGMFGSRLRKRRCCRLAVATGMAGGAGGECGEGKDEENVFHVFFSEWVGFRLLWRCVAA